MTHRIYTLFSKIILLLTIPLFSAITLATPANTNQTSSIVINNPDTNQNANFVKAYTKLLIKFSGNPTVMTLPAIRASLPNVATMVKSYSTVTNTTQPNQPALQVVFDKGAIQKVLTAAGQPMWDAKRPTTLVWLSITDNDGHQTVLDSTSNTNPIVQSIQTNANSRGLPILFPLLDLSDQNLNAKHKADNSLLTTSDMQTLANRYHVDSVLAGVISEVGNQWQAQWRYVLDSAPITWGQPLTSASNIGVNAINTVASTMIDQLALSSPTDINTSVYLTINHIAGLTDYATVMQCLKSINGMVGINPVDLDANHVILKVHYQGPAAQLTKDLLNQCHLTSIPATNLNDPLNTTNNDSSTNLQTLSFQYTGSSND